MTAEEPWVEEVLRYWFEELKPADWWMASRERDAEIARRFGPLHLRIALDVPDAARTSARACLAAVVVLDQMSRNIHRGTPGAFACDGSALALAEHAIAVGFDQATELARRVFFYLPFEHSEDPVLQARSLALFTALGDPTYLDYAERHKVVIDRFGRFPHRNAILGRASTAEELAFLETPGSSF